MKAKYFFLAAVFTVILFASEFYAQVGTLQASPKFVSRNMGGPRLGVTFIHAKGELKEKLDKKQIGSLVSQFGWHFEYQVVPETEGPSFVIQFVPLAGGVEYATLIPAATVAFGIRFPGGFEFGMGPNLVLTDKGFSPALIMAVGQSFQYGGVSIPLNLAVATNPEGLRASIIFGYAIDKTSQK